MFPLLDSNSNPPSVYNSSQTVKFLRSCHLEVGMKNNVKWELTPEIVARHFLRNVSTPVTTVALRWKLPWEAAATLLGKGVIIQLKLGKAFFF